MTKKAKQYPNPRFSSLEEEEEYWKTHSPLDEGYEGEVQKTKQKRASFLTVRLTGEELTQLRDMAAKFGMGPSTYARQVLKLIIEQEYMGMHYPSFLLRPLYDSSSKRERAIRGLRETKFRSLAESILGDEEIGKRICIFDPDEMEVDPATVQAMFNAMLKACRAKVVTPEDDDYKTIQNIVKTRE